MNKLLCTVGFAALMVSTAACAEPPSLLAVVSISEQKVRVYVDVLLPEPTYTWDVSTSTPANKDCTVGGAAGAHAVDCVTPTGTFGVVWTTPMAHAAAKWHHAPMPHAVFFDHQGDAFHAIDGTAHELSRLGHPDSHGCVRLLPENAAIWYNLVEQHHHGNGWPGVVIQIHN